MIHLHHYLSGPIRDGGLTLQDRARKLYFCRENNLDPSSIKGSYAGALESPNLYQAYRNYAIDFDGDSYADLWSSNADVIGSVQII